tara:strand:- start:275 stop:481 length:207 start_codon:yes stop_codon:yes gene_type:complete
MDWEENIGLRDLVVKLKNSAHDKEYFKKFISQVANDEEFAGLLIFALESELQDRHWRKAHGRNVGKKT